MYTPDSITSQGREPTVALAPAQQNAVTTHITNLIEALGLTNQDLLTTDTQQPYIAHAQLPLRNVHPFTSPDTCLELDTTSPHHHSPTRRPRSTVRSTTPIVLQDVDPPFTPWTLADEERMRLLLRARTVCHSALNNVHASLLEIDEELSSIQHGRRPREQGGDWSRSQAPHSRSARTAPQGVNTANTQAVNGNGDGDGDANTPPFLTPYLPPPSPPPNPLADTPGTRRCTVDRPVGKVLRPSERYYHLGRCDKHHDKSAFETNMQVQQNTGGGHRMREHAWKCSGEVTGRRGTVQRL